MILKSEGICLLHAAVFLDYCTLCRRIYEVKVHVAHISHVNEAWTETSTVRVLCGVCVVSVSVRSVSVLVRCWFGFVSVSVWFR